MEPAAMKLKPAFTLIEVVLAMSVSAIVMLGCCLMMFDLMTTAERLERGWSLKSHADGVERFLRASFNTSLLLYPSRINDVQAQNASKTLAIAELPESVSSDYGVVFAVNGQHPLFLSPTKFSPAKICWLNLDDDGLSIIWRHANPEDKNSDAAVYKTKISPFVKQIGYLYQDESGWREEDELDTSGLNTSGTEGNSNMPSYIKLYFSRGDEKLERIISLSGMMDPVLQ